VRGPMEVRRVIVKRLIRLGDMKPIACVARVAQLITSNHLRDD
jgi:hypothetical protein